MSHFRLRRVLPVPPADPPAPDAAPLSALLPPDLLRDLALARDSAAPPPPPAASPRCMRVPRALGPAAAAPAPAAPPPADPPAPAAAPFAWFEVRVAGAVLYAVSIYDCRPAPGAGAVVRHGPFLRYGEIARQLRPDECASASFQLVAFDADGALGAFLRAQTRAAAALCGAFIARDALACRLLHAEIVSYRTRALLRLRVTDAGCPGIESLVQRLIAVFCMAVEVYA
jgi:hypothetical protein